MRKNQTLFFLLLLMGSLLLSPGCWRSDYTIATGERQYRSCIGEEEYAALNLLREAFDQFLADNGYLDGHNNLYNGYRAYLYQVIHASEPDSNWVFREGELEEILQRFEELHMDALLYQGSLQKCVFNIDYPDTLLMASYREIMPQHTVPPQRFAEVFLHRAGEQEFEDPVLKIMVALEYFLGPVLGILRPDGERRPCC